MEQRCGAAEEIRSRWVSVCQTDLLRLCSVSSCFVTLYIALIFIFFCLSGFVLFHGFPVLAESNRRGGGDMQQRR